MPRRHRCRHRRRPGRGAEPHRLARRAGPARLGHGLRWTLPPGRSLSRGALGRRLCRPDAQPVRPHRRFRLDRRLRAARLRALCPPQADAGGHAAPGASAPCPAVSPQRRHHRRGADDQDPPGRPALAAQGGHAAPAVRRPRAGRAGGILHRAADRRRHLRLRRRGGALRGPAGDRGAGLAQQRPRAQSPVLCRRQVPAVHASGRARAPHAGRRAAMDGAAHPGRRVAGPAGRALRDPRCRRGAGRDLPARQPAFPGCLSVRRAGSPIRRSACC